MNSKIKKIGAVCISVVMFLLIKGIRYEISRNIREANKKEKEKEIIYKSLDNSFLKITEEKIYQIKKDAFDSNKTLEEKLKIIDKKLESINEEYSKKLKQTTIKGKLNDNGREKYFIADEKIIQQYMEQVDEETLKNLGYGFSYLQTGLNEKDLNKIETGEDFLKKIKLEDEYKKNIENYSELLKELAKELADGYVIKENINIYYEYYKAFTEKEKNSYSNFNLDEHYYNQKDLSFCEKMAYLKIDKCIKNWIFLYELDKWEEQYIAKSMMKFSDDIIIEFGKIEQENHFFEDTYIKILLNSKNKNELENMIYNIKYNDNNKIEIKIKDKIYKFYTKKIHKRKDLVIIEFIFKSSSEKEFLNSLSKYSDVSMLINNNTLIKFEFPNKNFLNNYSKLIK